MSVYFWEIGVVPYCQPPGARVRVSEIPGTHVYTYIQMANNTL